MSTASDTSKAAKVRLGGTNAWLILLLLAMALFGLNTGVATWQGSRLADASTKAADLQVLSQQLANQGREAVAGNAQAFTAFKATRAAIDENVATLQGRYGTEPGVSAPIGKLAATWQPLAKSAAQLVSSEPAVLTLAGADPGGKRQQRPRCGAGPAGPVERSGACDECLRRTVIADLQRAAAGRGRRHHGAPGH